MRFRLPRLPDRKGQRQNALVCEASLRDLVQRETLLAMKVEQCTRGGGRPAPVPQSSSTAMVVYDPAKAAQAQQRQQRQQRQQGQQGCSELVAQLAGVRAQLAGERAKCSQGARIERKGAIMQARSERAGMKTEIFGQRQARRQAELETAMQRQQYKMQKVQLRNMRRQAGQGGTGSTMIKVAGLAAAAAAALLL